MGAGFRVEPWPAVMQCQCLLCANWRDSVSCIGKVWPVLISGIRGSQSGPWTIPFRYGKDMRPHFPVTLVMTSASACAFTPFRYSPRDVGNTAWPSVSGVKPMPGCR